MAPCRRFSQYRCRAILVAADALSALSPQAHGQSNYPSRVVRIIVPTSPGGANDTIARLVAQGLSERLGRQVVVENRPGAGTTMGGDFVAKSQADGHTLLMGLSTLATNAATYKKMPYDALRDFAPITQAVFTPNLMIVHPSLPAKSVQELIALARARPGEILYASSGHGTNPHLSLELFCSMARIRMVHVPYKSSVPGMIDLLAGQVAVLSSPMLQAIPFVRAGRLRALGVTSSSRVAAAPDIPTIAEGGLRGYESVQWYGLLAPAKTPPEIIEKLHREVVAILRTPEARDRFAADGAELVASSPGEFAVLLKAETVKWARVAKAAGITPE
jgi:tripartite-type tricarboxylate transporter receptor subunit TctC